MRPSRKTPSAQPGTAGLSYGLKIASIAAPNRMSATRNDLGTRVTCGSGSAPSREIQKTCALIRNHSASQALRCRRQPSSVGRGGLSVPSWSFCLQSRQKLHDARATPCCGQVRCAGCSQAPGRPPAEWCVLDVNQRWVSISPASVFSADSFCSSVLLATLTVTTYTCVPLRTYSMTLLCLVGKKNALSPRLETATSMEPSRDLTVLYSDEGRIEMDTLRLGVSASPPHAQPVVLTRPGAG